MTDATTRRLFFALWPDSAIRRTLQRTTRTAVRRCGGRPVRPDNYHITVAFLGNVAVDLCTEIIASAASVPVPTLTLTLDRFGYWPRPRVFWLGPTRCPQPLSSLADNVWRQMETLGLPRERRPYHAHVTLCRKVRSPPAVDEATPVRWPIEEFALVESITAADGARYSVIEQFPAG